MRTSICLLALTAIGVAAFAPAAHAQDMTTATFNGTTIWVGGGVQFLIPPRHQVHRTERPQAEEQRKRLAGFRRQRLAAGIETALGMWGGSRVTGGVKGFWANIETDDRKNCNGRPTDCVVVDPDRSRLSPSSRRLWSHQDQPRRRLLGRSGRAQIRARRAGVREAESLPQRLFHRRRRRARHRSGQHACGSSIGTDLLPTRRASIPPIRRLYRPRRRIQLRLHPGREECRRTLRSSRPADLHLRARRPLQRRHRL